MSLIEKLNSKTYKVYYTFDNNNKNQKTLITNLIQIIAKNKKKFN
jgi:hypothetical protein